jgi:tetratricopeptide (TPR) repeat protein
MKRYFTDRIEPDINDEGYRLMGSGKNELASGLLEINTKIFPESANAYDSYAESLMLLGKNEEALKYYEMAIAKDKEGVTAENSRKMIDKIKTKKGF